LKKRIKPERVGASALEISPPRSTGFGPNGLAWMQAFLHRTPDALSQMPGVAAQGFARAGSGLINLSTQAALGRTVIVRAGWQSKAGESLSAGERLTISGRRGRDWKLRSEGRTRDVVGVPGVFLELVSEVQVLGGTDH